MPKKKARNLKGAPKRKSSSRGIESRSSNRTTSSRNENGKGLVREISSRSTALTSAAKLNWRFLHQSKYDGRKWGEPAIYATPRTLESLVRETAQNSLDAGEGAKVTMRYRLYDLPAKSKRYTRLMKALNFSDELRLHLESAVEAAAKRDVGRRLSDGLDVLEALERPLRILVIDDYGAKGLGGDEFESGSAFAALIRDISNSQKSDNEAGGSYGLGSRTLFGSSKVMTVIFGSVIFGENPSVMRLIGKSELSYHTLGKQQYAGRGWMGSPEGADGAHSVRVSTDDSLVEALLLKRTPPAAERGAFGTSAVILGYSETMADEQTGDEVAERISKAAGEYFWPAIAIGRLAVEVEHYIGDEDQPSYARKVRPAEYVPSLVDAFERFQKEDLSERLAEPGDTVSEPIELVVPATNANGGVEPQHPETTAECRLVIRLSEPESTDRHLAEHVGYTRGRGMITQYFSRKNLAAGARPYHAVLLAGTLVGKGSPERAAEVFLRAAEPPAHNEWHVENLGSRYMRGGGKRLEELDQRVREALRKHVCLRPIESDEGPEVLREIFRLKKLPNPPEPGIRITAAQAPFAGGVYRVSATLSPERDGGCRILPLLSVVKEQGQPIKTEWVSIASPDADFVDGAFIVPPGLKRIRITGQARLAQPGLLAERCVVRLSAAYVKGGVVE